MIWSKKFWRKLKSLSPLSYALRLLKARLRSRFELDQALQRKGFLEQERLEILEQLEGVDLINDERFARSWITSRDRLSPRGVKLLKMELAQKGIAKEIVAQALSQRETSDEPPDEVAQAKDLVERKERQYAGLPKEVRNRRVTALLLRRGFSFGTIKRILET